MKEQPGGGQFERLSFIERRLFWLGRFNRRELGERFGLSATRQTADMGLYKELSGHVEYNRLTKSYHPTKGFSPVLTGTANEDFTSLLLVGDLKGALPPERLSVAPSPLRSVDGAVTRAVVQAIGQNWSLKILYASMSRPEPIWRVISPHAMGSDGQRWHVRAFCHEAETYKDFVLGRILEVGERGSGRGSLDQDREWHEVVDLVVVPDPRLSQGARKAIESDFCMENGQAVIQVRRALLWYVAKHWNLDGEPFEDPRRQQIVLQDPNILIETGETSMREQATSRPRSFTFFHPEEKRQIRAGLEKRGNVYVWVDQATGERLENLDPADSVTDACEIAASTFAKAPDWKFTPTWA